MRGSCCRTGSAILMNSPRQPDGPPIRDGKPYSRARASCRGRHAVRRGRRRAQETRAVRAGHLCLRPRSGLSPARRSRRPGVRGRDCQGPTRWQSSGARRLMCCSPWPSAPPPELLPIEGHAPYRLPAYRCRRDAHRGLAADRLVLAGAARQADAASLARRVRGAVASAARKGRQMPIPAGCCAITTRRT